MLIAAALLAGCATSDEPLRVGAAGNWREFYGVMSRRGIDLATGEINAGGGISGRPFEVVFRDDSSSGPRAVAIASEFVADPEILGVIGHIESGTMLAAAPVYDRGLPAIATTATTPSLSGLSSWTFRVISSDSVNGRDLALHARALRLGRAAILYENNAYGRGLADAFGRAFAGEIVAREPIAADSSGDVEPHVSWIRLLRPDVVFVAGSGASGVAVLREARRQGLETTFLGGDGWSAVTAAGDLAEGAVVAVPFTPADPRESVRRFTAAFRQRFGVDPDANAALAYDATHLLGEALRHGTSRTQVRDWLATLETSPWRGVTGDIAFNAAGDVDGRGMVMTRVRGRSLVTTTGQGS